ncbi:hypothetical protein JKP88DRAFT_266926 [Tribonema minus]|uniref:Uncharacterized protein n=1 Tax=Tribonema minus TaxID=303371 RepID=A0A835ZDR8_9STRA|nr:hypothetical protein JKP88DRAFT_266926 [Tribonema minus]
MYLQKIAFHNFASSPAPQCMQVLEGLQSIKGIAGEWGLEVKRVHKGSGSIAAAHVKVTSAYAHRPAPPPAATNGADDHSHTSDHHHSHAHGHSHSHSHDAGARAAHQHLHAHSHSHDSSSDVAGGDEGSTSAADSKDSIAGGGGTVGTGGVGSGVGSAGGDVLRNFAAIAGLLRDSGLPPAVISTSIAAFHELAVAARSSHCVWWRSDAAEAHTHGTTVDEVHFHEVGAIDSIVDTCYCSPLPFSGGTVWTAHGILPVPAPATLRLMMGMPTCPGPRSASGELVTPTGACLIRVLCAPFDGGASGRPPPFTPSAVGVGAGTKEFDGHPNVLRVVLGDAPAAAPATPLPPAAALMESAAHAHVVRGVAEDVTPAAETAATDAMGDFGWNESQLTVLEANIDDATGEELAHLISECMAAGALDSWCTPIAACDQSGCYDTTPPHPNTHAHRMPASGRRRLNVPSVLSHGHAHAVMKKGRPAHTLHLLCQEPGHRRLAALVFLEGATLGIRSHAVERFALPREQVSVATRYGSVRVKVGRQRGRAVSCKPEHDDCAALARRRDVPLRTVAAAAVAAWRAAEAAAEEQAPVDAADAERRREDGSAL